MGGRNGVRVPPRAGTARRQGHVIARTRVIQTPLAPRHAEESTAKHGHVLTIICAKVRSFNMFIDKKVNYF